ncbi:unnamed protein product [Rotaria sp. Silwood2]|nr:unnamed protein product [Rotaria sp. Silwood2]CAF3066517.1 unnamed protein product [Rotaria sp. Silwood2]CAF3159669.1 unnamed protein product [Rotaria sp. Silwood2]CAF4031529.1 unnamed protein product [Rotaria sp. Silwood2]CAF4288362.1 unnamed protein product [Rotaria sp. Silwood2]
MTDVVSSHNQWLRSTMPESSYSQHHYRKNNRRSLQRLINDKSSQTSLRKITLYRNGDRYFPGKQIAIAPQNYTKLRQLLQELSSTIDLPYGVRRLFTPQNGSEITDINSLKDGASYICASFEPFQKLEYVTNYVPYMTFHVEQLRQPLHDYHSSNRVNVRHLPSIPLSKVGAINGPAIPSNAGTNRFHTNNILLQSFSSTASNSIQQQQQQHKRLNFRQNKYNLEPLHSKPRTITIVKQGNEKPHKTITILLNKRTGQTLDQLLSDISEAFGHQKHRTDKIKRLYNLRGRQINGINDFFREDEIFIASTHTNEISSEELQEISLETSSDYQPATSRRIQFKKVVQSPIDRDSSNTQLPTTGLVSVDIRKTVNVRDSGFLDDEDGLSSKDNELPSSRQTNNNKQNEIISENASTPYDLINRKLKKTLKPPASTLSIEQQRERERQRVREEDERRKRLPIKKDQQQSVSILPVPKFEPLILDFNNDELSHSNKIKTPTSVINKPLSIAPLPRLSITAHHDENEIKESVSIQKIQSIKKRSSVVYPSPAIVSDKYDFGKKMGDGNFAIVRRSKLRGNEREFAIKIIDKSKMKGKEYMLDHEINIMYLCHHPNIIRLFEDYETPDEIYLVMELIKGGDLFDYITKHRRFDESTSALMIKDVSEALLYLHTKKIVHRDLKPENLLVMQKKDGRITIKLTDFGLAMHVTGPIKTVCGTPTYVAPEILAETGYGIEVDCWATGIILYILLCGYPPFKTVDRNQDELFQMIQRGKFTYDSEYWDSISSSAKDLIDHLLIVDQQKRIRADEILLHPWIMSTGHTKPMGNTEELKSILRLKYEAKIKEYAIENNEN